MSNTTNNKLSIALGKAFLPLKNGLKSNDAFKSFMLNLGWKIDIIPQPMLTIVSSVDDLIAALIEVQENKNNPNSYLYLFTKLKTSFKDISDLESADFSQYPDLIIDDFGTKFPKQLIDYLIYEYTRTNTHILFSLLRWLNIFQTNYANPAGLRPSYLEIKIQWNDLFKIINQPKDLLEAKYKWGTVDFDFIHFFSDFQNILNAVGINNFVKSFDSESMKKYNPETHDILKPMGLYLPFFYKANNDVVTTAGLNLLPFASAGFQKTGFSISPFFRAGIEKTYSLNENSTIGYSSNVDLETGLSLDITNDGINIRKNIMSDNSAVNSDTTFRAWFLNSNAENDTIPIIAAENGNRIAYSSLSVVLGGKITSKNKEAYIEVNLNGGELVFDLGKSDGFLSKVLPLSIETPFEVKIGVSTESGLYFNGSSGLEVELPIHIKTKFFELKNVKLQVINEGSSFYLDCRTTIVFLIGSLTLGIYEVGLSSELSFNQQESNFGPINLETGLKLPKGISINIDGGKINGGGFLKIDQPNKRYTGFLQLKAGKVTFTATGILRTELPGGKEGYSLLMIVTAEGFKPIQLGFGFQLEGIGGLLGLNRTADIDVLRAGIKTGNNEKILFPKNIIENVDAVISALDTSFPEKEGRFIFGPVAKIGWGSGGAKLVNIDLALLIEVPKPVKLAIIGVVKAIMPPLAQGQSEENAKMVIKVSFFGVFDFDKKQISFDASLFKSRIANLNLSGDMAFRLYYGDNANFLMSVGGFHPSYTPPPMDLPTLKRLNVSVIDKPDVKVNLEAYFAITSNTVQIGAKLTAYANAGPFNLVGMFWLDALFQFKPFYFIVNVGGMVAIRKGNKELLTAGLELTLQGPSPWRIDGVVYFTILRVEKSIRISKHFGDTIDEQIEDVNVLPELTAAIDNPDNWLILNKRGNDIVTTRKTKGDDLFLHPIGTVAMNQSAVPLELTIEKFANAKPKDYSKFYFESFKINTKNYSEKKLTESFAPALFRNLNNEQKLSAPSFEKYKSGFELGTDEISAEYLTKRVIEYNPVVIDRAVKDTNITDSFLRGDNDFLYNTMVNINTAADAGAGQSSLQKPFDAPIKAAVTEKGYTIRKREDQVLHNNEVFGTYLEAQSYLTSLTSQNEDLIGTIAVMANSDI